MKCVTGLFSYHCVVSLLKISWNFLDLLFQGALKSTVIQTLPWSTGYILLQRIVLCSRPQISGVFTLVCMFVWFVGRFGYVILFQNRFYNHVQTKHIKLKYFFAFARSVEIAREMMIDVWGWKLKHFYSFIPLFCCSFFSIIAT